jgi:poly(A)-specific ribonuclease
MDITATNFDASLQGMLECLAGSHFVTLDLELSGVPSVVTGHGLDRMQDRYRDLKAAADKFSAVQVGFTIVHRDTSAGGGYAAYPYNMYLRPIIGERLDVSRNLTFSGRGMSFTSSTGLIC